MTKSIPITKQMVWESYKKVRANKGSAGIDGVSLKQFEEKLSDNLYKVWNRLSSGSYYPPAVKEVEIPKKDGGKRLLGIPTVGDRVAQMVVKDYLEPRLEKEFLNQSYGYRPLRNAHQALEEVRKNCWQYNWVIDLDIKGFFDNIDHQLLNRALEKHVDERWVLMYIERWLQMPVQKQDGQQVAKQGKGTPQGGVISPLLANLFLHYAFDKWLVRNVPSVRFVRYADDAVIHCRTEEEAKRVVGLLQERMQTCKLQLHEKKTKIVYCKDGRRKGQFKTVQFDFLGFSFQPRPTYSKRNGKVFLSFDLAISKNARKKIVANFRSTKFQNLTNIRIEDIARALNPRIRGWIYYYGKFRKSALRSVFRLLHHRLMKWILHKYKRLGVSIHKAYKCLKGFQKQFPNLFVHWQHGFME